MKGKPTAYADRFKPFQRIVRDHGYKIEKHFYETADNYINCTFRIPGPAASTKENTKDKPVIVLQHGLNDSSQCFMIDGKDSLALFFVDAGFDVWLNNTRGNRFSQHHKFFDPKYDDDYWNYSFQELGKYDQPAFIDYVREQTG